MDEQSFEEVSPRIKSKSIIDEYWYVVDIIAFPTLKILNTPFINENSAYNGIDNGLYGDHKRYDVIQGKEAKELGINFFRKTTLRKRHKPLIRVRKYNYPAAPKKVWSEYSAKRQYKKSFRTVQRYKERKKLLKEKRNEEDNL